MDGQQGGVWGCCSLEKLKLGKFIARGTMNRLILQQPHFQAAIHPMELGKLIICFKRVIYFKMGPAIPTTGRWAARPRAYRCRK